MLSATRWQTTPRFDIKEVDEILNLDELEKYRPAGSLAPSFGIPDAFRQMAYETGNGDLVPIQYKLYDLAHFLDNVPAQDPGLLDRSSFSDRVYVVEHDILVCLQRSSLLKNPILQPLMHSFLLWLYTNIRLTPARGQIRFTLIARLRRYLESANVLELNVTNPHELRWMLFLGGASAGEDSEQRAWFVNTMVNIGCRREWSVWADIQKGLKGFEKAFLIACGEYWNDVDEAMGERGHKAGRHGPYCIGEDDYFTKDWRAD